MLKHVAPLRIGLIGPGRAGAPIAAALAKVGHQVSAVSAVSDFSKTRAAAFVPTAQLLDPVELIQNVDLVILAVPDDALSDLVVGLSHYPIHPQQIWMHLSGAHGLLPLFPVMAKGAIGIAAHPAMTFTGDISDIERLQECPFALTAEPEAAVVGQALILEMGGKPFFVSDSNRVQYHAALSHAANHLNTLISQSAEILASIGIENPGEFLLPLTSNALEHALANGVAALTGPIVRGDVGTVRQHLNALAEPGKLTPGIYETYLQLARATYLNCENRIAKTNRAELREVLGL